MPSLSKISSKKLLTNAPLVSVIIPARNEEKRIKKCIQALKTQTYSNLEIFIVDDHSSDKTVEISRRIIGDDKRFKIISLKDVEKEKPKGWIGKSYAIQQGCKHANGDWLLFCDVDYMEYNPNLIRRGVEYVIENNIDFLSLMPSHICGSFWEKAIQPVPLGLLSMLSPIAQVNKSQSRTAIAFGCFILISHSIFNKLGGYTKIRDRIADDVELAKLVKQSGFKIGLALGRQMLKIRMYEGFDEVWQGWNKNIFLGVIQKCQIRSKILQFLFTVVGLFCLFCVMVFPFLLLLSSIFLILFIPSVMLWRILLYSLLVWIFSIFVQSYVQKCYSICNPKYAPVVLLVGGFVTMGMFLNSAIKVLSGTGVIWKDRIYFNRT